ncbi:MAG: hypothetical protein HYS12_06885 [Planctomycetes bacterium]|nr:hypothetical protein [Planctomycetota bacterium]
MPTIHFHVPRVPFALFSGILLLLPSVAVAQATPAQPSIPDLVKRIQQLEETVRRLEAERAQRPHPEPLPPPLQATPTSQPAEPQPDAPREEGGNADGIGTSPAPGGSATGGQAGERSSSGGSERGRGSPLAGWDDKRGFYLRSSDNKFNLRLTGQIQGDYRAFLDGDDRTDIDTFLVRRARLGIEATVFNAYEFRLLPDFSNAQTPGGPAQTRIQDAYLNVHYWDAFQFEIGKFKQPFSYEQLIQDRFVPTLERSMIDQLVPARDEGVMVHGQKLFGDRLDYALSVSNGEINADFDSEKRKDLNARLAVRPLNDPEFWPVVRGLQLGVAGTIGIEQEPVSPTTLRTPGTVPWFQFNSTVRADGLRRRLSPELVYFYKGLGFAAQYFYQEQRLRPTFSGAGSQFVLDVPFRGFYVLSTLLLTGEERTTYSQAIMPLRPFDPCHPLTCPGAWELVARTSRLTISDEVFEPLPPGRTTFLNLADPTRYSNGATELTLGFNWYLNAWVRMQFNWEHAWFDDPVRLGPGPGGLLRHQDSLLSRLQVIF